MTTDLRRVATTYSLYYDDTQRRPWVFGGERRGAEAEMSGWTA